MSKTNKVAKVFYKSQMCSFSLRSYTMLYTMALALFLYQLKKILSNTVFITFLRLKSSRNIASLWLRGLKRHEIPPVLLKH